MIDSPTARLLSQIRNARRAPRDGALVQLGGPRVCTCGIEGDRPPELAKPSCLGVMNTASVEVEHVVKAYAQVWAEPDRARRLSLLVASMTPDAEILGPGYHYKGHDHISREVERFHREQPGVRAVLASGLDVHHNLVRFAFAIVQPDGSVSSEGVDVLVLADGHIARVYTFFGPLPSVPSSWPAELVVARKHAA